MSPPPYPQVSPPPGLERNLIYDQYTELSAQTRLAQANLAVNVVQTGLMSEMRESLVSITSVMDDLRRQQDDTLAMQHEMLMRDQIQSRLEEFIYRAEKQVAECLNPASKIPGPIRYFMLKGLTATIDQEGIGTPIIRGRDNKAAFDKVVAQANRMIDQLQRDPEVKKAIQWAEAERRRRLAEENRKRQQRQSRFDALNDRLAELEQSRFRATIVDGFKEMAHKIENWGLLPKDDTARTVVFVVVGCASLFLFPFALMASPFVLLGAFIEAKGVEQKRNEAIDAELDQVRKELEQLEMTDETAP